LKKSAEALSGTAVAYLKMKNGDNALDAAKQALDLNKNDLQAHQIAAQIYFEKNDYRNAQPQLEFLVNQMAANSELMGKLSTCYKNNNEFAKLLTLDSKIVLTSSDNIESRKRLAARADSLKLLDSAKILYTQLSVLDPKDASSFKRLFQIAASNSDLPASVTMQFNRYIAIKGNDAEAYRDYGDFLYVIKDMDGALNAYRRALELNPQLKGFHKRYAEIVIAKGQEDEAITACTKLITNGEADAGTYSTLGSIYLKKKNYLKAVEMYQNALQLQPADINVLGDLADVQLLSGDKKSAAISYEQIVMMNTSSVKEYKVLGEIYMALSRNDEAVKAYKKYNEKMPSDAAVAIILGKDAYVNKTFSDVVKYLWREGIVLESPENLMLGDALLESGKFQEAVIPLEKVMADRKKQDKKVLEKAFVLLAGAYEKSGRNADAAAIYGEYLTLPGVNDPDASYKRACLLETSDPVVAVRLFENNIRTYPADYRNFLKAGIIMSSKKETLEKSIEYLRRVTELASEKPDVWLELARVYGKLRKPGEELDAYKRFAESNPQSIEANSRIGTLLMQKGMRNEAMVYLELANTLKPNDPDIMILLADGYQRTGRLTDAVDLLVKAKAKRPEEASLSLALFECYAETNQKEKALAEIKALVDKTPMTEYKVKYAEYLSSVGKNHEASELLEAILAEEPENFDVMMLQAKVLRGEKKYDQAVEIYKSINSLMPDHIMSMFERAETHLEQSKLQWADMFYNRVLKIDPQFALAELGLARVAKIKKDQNAYREHLDKAKALDPENKRILDEVNQK
jgi:tetratricopeptide (TPR) repeat protein